VGNLFTWLSGGRGGQGRSWYTFGAAVVSGLLAIGVLLVAVGHRDAHLPSAENCPTAARVNTALGTRVRSPTAVSEADLLGCFYQQGSDQQAVSVSFASLSAVDPCRRRPRIVVSGHEACRVNASRGMNKNGISLLVETKELQDQFTSNSPSLSLTRLEGLAVTVLATPPPRLEKAVAGDEGPENRDYG
jgi:hypothetical protein